ncbi:hypothetical protein PSN45_003949 [Yamadazyma tenuis]|uniref:uncharacterized protein n=1 Tax=Candida tenuis TaxID=2315449 RepID=UPI00279DCC74|nr:hypothetical protein PSN45_003949 [Yamadazyma tenuis]
MWPHKKGLGVQLTYGVKGPGIIEGISSTNSFGGLEAKVSHPILDEPPLAQLSTKVITLVKKQTDVSNFKYRTHDTNEKKSSKALAKEVDLAISSRLLQAYQVPSEIINSSEAYDPTFGKTIEFFHIKSKVSHSWKPCVVAHASGSIGHVLNVSLVESSIVDNKNDNTVPRFRNTVKLELDETIKQIESFRPLVKKIPVTSDDHILVRTSSWIYVINVFYNADIPEPLVLSLVDRINVTALKGHTLADMVWSPQSKLNFVVIDVKGNIFNMKLNGVKIKPYEITLEDEAEEQQRIFDNTLQLSNWRKVLWPKKSVIFVSTRTSFLEIDLDTRSSQKLITAETWSRIRDIDIPRGQAKYMFILTSREIIWLDISEEPKRLISWKHFLNEKDPSLRLTVTPTGDKFHCLIFCQSSPLVLCCSFGVKNENPFCLSSPSLVYLQGKEVPLQHLSLIPLTKGFYRKGRSASTKKDGEDVFGLFELRSNLELNFNTLAPGNIKSSEKRNETKSIDFDVLLGQVETDSIRPYRGTYFDHLTKKDMLPFVEGLTQYKVPYDYAEVEAIQEYAFKLGEGTDRVIDEEIQRKSGERVIKPSYLSLLDLSNEIPKYIKRPEELDTMLEQLQEFYSSKSIALANTTNTYFDNSKLVSQPPSEKTALAVYKHLKHKYYSRSEIKPQTRSSTVKRLANLMVLNSVKVKPRDLASHYAVLADEEYDLACSSTKAILNDWDTDYTDNNTITTVIDQFSAQRGTPPEYSAPSIVITSQDTSTQKNQKSKKNNMRKKVLNSQFAQSQTQVPTLVDTPASSQQNGDTFHLSSSSPSSQSSSQPSQTQSQPLSSLPSSQSVPTQSYLSSQKRKPSSNHKHKKKKKKLAFA